MGKIHKSTKRFSKNHLSDEIARRRKTKLIKAQRSKGKRQSVDEDEDEPVRGNARGAEALKPKTAKKKIEDLDVDELLRGDFLEDPEEDREGSADGDNSGDEEDDSDGADLSEEEEDDFVDITPPEAEDAEDSSEDEEEEDGDSTVRGQNKRLTSDVEKHKKELEALKKKDPEFYKFLEDHDQELLEFDDEEGEDAEDEEGGAAEEKTQRKDKKSKRDKAVVEPPDGAEVTPGKEAEGRVLTSAMVDAWADSAVNKQSAGAAKYLLRAFRTACHYGDGEGEEMSSSFSIASSHVFSKVMLLVLREMDGILRRALAPAAASKGGGEAQDEGPPPYPAALTKSPRWKKVEPLAKSYIGNALHVIGQMTDSAMIAFALRRLRSSVPLLAAFPKFARKYLKLALHFWATEEEGALPVVAAVFVREMAVLLGPEWLEACLRGSYRSFAANCKFVNAAALPRVDFMSRFLVELYGLDPVASYQQAFVFIRQLALILRTALTSKTQESCRAVYSWQFMSCLGAWVRVLSMHSGNHGAVPGSNKSPSADSLGLLIYPLTQIITGTSQLVPTARYFPLRVQCARMLNCLAGSTSQFVPVAPLLLGMLSFSDLRKAPTGGAGKPSDFTTILKVPKQIIKTRAFQEDCVVNVMELLAEHLGQWAYSVAFPELAVVPLVQLRRFAKDTPVERFRRQAKQLIQNIERNVEFVLRKRDAVSFAPKDASAVADFLAEEKAKNASPMAQYASGLLRQADEKRRQLRSKDIVFGGRGRKRGGEESGMQDAGPSGRQQFSKKRGREDDGDGDEDELQYAERKVAMEEDEGHVEKEGEAAFGKGWLPSKKKADEEEEGRKKGKKEKSGKKAKGGDDGGDEEDVVEDLVFSDDEDSEGPTAREEDEEDSEDDERDLPEGVRRKGEKVHGGKGNGVLNKGGRNGKSESKSDGGRGRKVRRK